MKPRIPIAVFVSRKEAGRAAGAAGLMRAISNRWPFARFHVFSTLPENLFKVHLQDFTPHHWSYHWYPAEVRSAKQPWLLDSHTDVCNCPVTNRPAPDGAPDAMAESILDLGCLMAISDAGGWGRDAAKKAGIPWLSLEAFGGKRLFTSCAEQLSDLVGHSHTPGDVWEASADLICRWVAAQHELLDVVSPEGQIVGAAPRCRVHGNKNWLHRVVHALVFDEAGRLLLQKRSFSKCVAPGKWDTSVGGHVDCGETVETALRREMAEELGICPESPQFAYQYIHSNDFESELVSTYICRACGSIRFNPDEIDAVRFWEIAEIAARLGTGLFSDNFEHEFALYQDANFAVRNPHS